MRLWISTPLRVRERTNSVVPPIDSYPAPVTYPTMQPGNQPAEYPAEDAMRPRPVVGIGVVGYGYWGPNLVRNFGTTPGARVVAVSDLSSNRLADVRAHYPAIKTTPRFEDMLLDPEIDAVAVA